MQAGLKLGDLEAHSLPQGWELDPGAIPAIETLLAPYPSSP